METFFVYRICENRKKRNIDKEINFMLIWIWWENVQNGYMEEERKKLNCGMNKSIYFQAIKKKNFFFHPLCVLAFHTFPLISLIHSNTILPFIQTHSSCH